MDSIDSRIVSQTPLKMKNQWLRMNAQSKENRPELQVGDCKLDTAEGVDERYKQQRIRGINAHPIAAGASLF